MNLGKVRTGLCIASILLVCFVAVILTLFLRSRESNVDSSLESLSTSRTHTDPSDKDSDGLKDDYELVFYHSLDESTDTDKDGLPDKLEIRLYDDLARSDDKDRDGLPDAWEMIYFKNLDQGPTDDPDKDGMSNLQELARGRGYNPSHPTRVVSKKHKRVSVSVSGQQSVAGQGKRASDGKIYYRKTYDRLVKQGKFDVPWEKLP